jgi:hypothetical protein
MFSDKKKKVSTLRLISATRQAVEIVTYHTEDRPANAGNLLVLTDKNLAELDLEQARAGLFRSVCQSAIVVVIAVWLAPCFRWKFSPAKNKETASA